MVAKFLDHNNREFLQQQKTISLDWQKNNVAHVSRFFAHSLAVVARQQHETS